MTDRFSVVRSSGDLHHGSDVDSVYARLRDLARRRRCCTASKPAIALSNGFSAPGDPQPQASIWMAAPRQRTAGSGNCPVYDFLVAAAAKLAAVGEEQPARRGVA